MDWDYAFGHAYWNAVLFPAPVSHPQAIWGFLQNFFRKAALQFFIILAISIHICRKNKQKRNWAQLGHLKAILAQARKQIVTLACGLMKAGDCPDSIRLLIDEAKQRSCCGIGFIMVC